MCRLRQQDDYLRIYNEPESQSESESESESEEEGMIEVCDLCGAEYIVYSDWERNFYRCDHVFCYRCMRELAEDQNAIKTDCTICGASSDSSINCVACGARYPSDYISEHKEYCR